MLDSTFSERLKSGLDIVGSCWIRKGILNCDDEFREGGSEVLRCRIIRVEEGKATRKGMRRRFGHDVCVAMGKVVPDWRSGGDGC